MPKAKSRDVGGSRDVAGSRDVRGTRDVGGSRDVRGTLPELSEKQLAELQAIDERLNVVLAERRAAQNSAPVRAERQVGSITFRYETVRCGKENCTRCPHGPYWYAYWKEAGRTRSRYIGRTLPAPARQSYEEKRQARLEKE